MERTFFGASLLRTAGRVFVLASLAGTVACGGCGDDPDNNTNVTPNGVTNGMTNGVTNGVTNGTTNVVTMGSIAVSPMSLTLSEDGGTGTYDIVLEAEPENNVTIDITSGDESEATVDTAQITFTPENWDTAQTVTVSAVDDTEFDGNQTISITNAATGTGNYAGISASDVSVTVTDNEVADIAVTPTGVTVFENGADATFEVVLSAAPTGTVTIPVAVSDGTEITVDVTELTFDDTNFGTAQTVTVSAIDDGEVEPAQTLSVILDEATGGGYDGVNPDDVSVTVIDDDQATVTVTPGILTTSETGTSGTFEVVLSSAPTDTVTIAVASSDATEGSVGPAALTFDANNFDTPQTVTVTGIDDTIVDGAQTYTVTLDATSNDGAYDGIGITPVAVTNTDDDAASAIVTPTSLTVSEAGTTSATFTVALGSAPGETVTVDIASSDLTEATVDLATLTFDDVNFGTPQTVTVTAEDDAEVDGNQSITITTTMNATAAYAVVDPADVNVQVIDDDQAGGTVTPTSGLVTTEAGGTDTFTVQLNSAPSANVTIDLTSSVLTEGTVSPSTLTFTTGNYATAQTVTVTGVDDLIDDGSQQYQIITAPAVSADAAFNGLNLDNVLVTNSDDDQAGYTVNPTSGLRTFEATAPAPGGTATFTVVLNTPPTADVTLPVFTTDSGEGTVAPTSITFTTADWDTPQTITVTGVDDNLRDGPQDFTIILDDAVSTDPGYSGLAPANVSVTNDDNEAGITVTPTQGLQTTEAGGTATFDVFLNSVPASNVAVSIQRIAQTNTVNGAGDCTGAVSTEATAGPTAITFTPADYATPKTFTLTGVDDATVDGNQTYYVCLNVSAVGDPNYDGLAAPDPDGNGSPNPLEVINVDGDAPGVTVNPTALSIIEGSTKTFNVTLNTQPSNDVVIALNTLNAVVATVTPASITLNAANWATGVLATVSSTQDLAIDGLQSTVITTAVNNMATLDPDYDNLTVADVAVDSIDDDSADIIIRSLYNNLGITYERNVLWESSHNAYTPTTFDIEVELTRVPTQNVLIDVTSADTTEATVSPAGLLFTTSSNGGCTAAVSGLSVCQTVTVTVVDDGDPDGTQTFDINFANTTSDPNFSGINPQAETVIVLDDEQPGGILVGYIDDALNTSENGGTDISLFLMNTPSTQPVVVTYDVTDDTESEVYFCNGPFFNGTASIDGSCTITIPVGQTISAGYLIGKNDAIADGDIDYQHTVTVTSADANYNNLVVVPLPATNADNDSASITVSPSLATYSEGTDTGALYDITLSATPTDDVVFTVSTTDSTEAVLGDAACTNRLNNCTVDSLQVTVPAGIVVLNDHFRVFSVDDQIADGTQDITITLGAAASADAAFDGFDADDVTFRVVDDEIVDVIVTPTGGLLTNEDGSTDTFEVVLGVEPTANVDVTFIAEDPDEARIQGTSGLVDIITLRFTPADWQTEQTVTVVGIDDAVNDFAQNFRILGDFAISADPSYNAFDVDDVTGQNADDDQADIVVSKLGGLITSEAGQQDTFTIALATQPTSDVVIDVSSSDLGEATVSPSQVTFTSSNWRTAVLITVTGVNETGAPAAADSPWSEFSVIFDPAVSTDPNYTGMNATDVDGINIDDDAVGVVVIEPRYVNDVANGDGTSGLIVSEDATSGSDSFLVRLSTPPSAPVTIELGTRYSEDVAFSPTSLTFTAADFATFQTVTVTGGSNSDFAAANNRFWDIQLGNDNDDDGTIDNFRPITTDSIYANVDTSGLVVDGTTLDDDVCNVFISPFTGDGFNARVTVDDGDTAPFWLTLSAVPSASVDIDVASPNGGGRVIDPLGCVPGGTFEGNVTDCALTTSLTTAFSPKAISVQGLNNGTGANFGYNRIELGNAVSTDGCFSGRNPNRTGDEGADAFNNNEGVTATRVCIPQGVGQPDLCTERTTEVYFNNPTP